MEKSNSPKELEALKKEIFSSLHCALPGNVVSFDAENQTAVIQPAVKLGSMTFPVLTDVPVFMPVPFDVHAGDACLVGFADGNTDGWFECGEPCVPGSTRKHSLSDGFAFIGFKVGREGDNG